MALPHIWHFKKLIKMTKKINSLPELKKLCTGLKNEGKAIITTNGVFDLLHAGHIRYLKKARALGDVLIVGLNSDASVKSLKGDKRPLVSEADRLDVIAALECVDYVCIFDEKTPLKFIEAATPIIHAKGGDYDPDILPEKAIVEKNGGKIKIIKFEKGYSTSSLIDLIIKRYSK